MGIEQDEFEVVSGGGGGRGSDGGGRKGAGVILTLGRSAAEPALPLALIVA